MHMLYLPHCHPNSWPILALTSIHREVHLKAITVRQPWAWLITVGIKPIENRSRPTSYRGPIAIHSSGTLYEDEYDAACRMIGGKISEDVLHLGAFIGTAELVDVVESHRSRWFRGPFGLLLQNPKQCNVISHKGQLGLWNVPAMLQSRIFSDHQAAPH